MLNGAPPSAAVLCALLADPEAPGPARRLGASLGAVTEWDALTAAAARTGLAGLLYRRTADTCPDAVPAAVLALWRERAGTLAQRSLRLQARLLAALRALEQSGVPALAIKGPALAEQVYGDATLRAFADLDLLVAAADAGRAREALLGLGYADRFPLARGVTGRLVDVMQEVVFVDPRGGVPVEVHWREGPRFAAHSIAAEDVLACSSQIELLGRPVPVPCVADSVLLVAVHAATHDWGRLEDVAALAAGLRRLSGAEQAALETQARKLGCARRLHLGVLLAVALADARPGRALWLPAFADLPARRLAAAQGRRLVAALETVEAHARSGSAARAGQILREARALDTCAATADYVWRRLLTPAVDDWDPAAGATASDDAAGDAASGPVRLARVGRVIRLQYRRQGRLWTAKARYKGAWRRKSARSG